MTIIDAICDGDCQQLEQLLEAGADPNFVEDDALITPLHYAAQYDRCDMAQILLHHGANLFAKTAIDQLTPLEVACLHKHWDIAELLAVFHCYLFNHAKLMSRCFF